jgi:hypothetical protein
MDAKISRDKLAATQSLSAHLLNLPPPRRYETACGQSTRMIIDSASYTTTPCSSPPPEPSHVFSAYDAHHKAPDVAALTEADHVLEQQMHQNEMGHYITRNSAQPETSALQISNSKEHTPNDRTQHHQGIIPPYVLEAIATSEAAGPQARASAEQTLLTSKAITHDRASKEVFVPTAPAQRQLKDGRWTVAF